MVRSYDLGLTAFRLSLLCCLVLLSSCTNDERNYVDDQAGLLDAQARQRIVALSRALLKDFNIHSKVMVLAQPSADINRDAAELFGDLGRTTGTARGLLFLVDPLGKQIRIEVGHDLEDVFPDIFVAAVERGQMTPFFAQNRVGAGIEATEELLVTRLQRAKEGKPFDPEMEVARLSHYSGGGGARTRAVIGGGTLEKTVAAAPGAWLPQSSPEQSLALYMRLLRDKIKDPNLALFTPHSRQFFARWVVTDAQQDNELHRLERAKIDKVVIAGNRAVIRFPLSDRTQPPYFLQQDGNGWAFDFAAMNDAIRMNHQNMWHFVSQKHDYMFAFVDWTFDANGFPRATR